MTKSIKQLESEHLANNPVSEAVLKKLREVLPKEVCDHIEDVQRSIPMEAEFRKITDFLAQGYSDEVDEEMNGS